MNVNDVEQIKNMDKDIRFVNYCGKEVWSKFVSFSVGVSSVIKNYMVFIGEPPVMQGYAPDNIIGRKLYGEKGKLFCVRIEFYRDQDCRVSFSSRGVRNIYTYDQYNSLSSQEEYYFQGYITENDALIYAEIRRK